MARLHPRRRSTVVGLLVSLLLPACSRAGSGGVPASPEPKGRNYPVTAADVRFMSHMIAHHAQALAMAGWAPTHGASPSVRTLADRIMNGQRDEIATMQRWLRNHGQPVPSPDPLGTQRSAPHSPGAGHEHVMLMPGMLTEAQMKELEQSRGSEFDRLFLTYMIQHHKGAVAMVNELFGTEGAAREETTFKLANDVSVDQSTEIARMERMLAALPPGIGSP